MVSIFDIDFDTDEVVAEFEEMMKKFRALGSIEKNGEGADLNGEFDITPIDEPNLKGYVIRGYFKADQPLEPLHPFEPFNPQRPPEPERRFRIPNQATTEDREPLTDLFEGENEIKIYAELPGEKKEDIRLNVTLGVVEIKSRKFYRTIKVPENIDLEKVTSRHRNSLLEITIPKKNQFSKDGKTTITID